MYLQTAMGQCVEVPPLGMVDYIFTISKCSERAIAMNSAVNSFIESKRLALKNPNVM